MGTPMQNISFVRKHYNNFQLGCLFRENGCVCGQTPINSHNLQNGGILKKLAVDSHVYAISESSSNDDFKLILKKVGVSKATIFRCLCSKHDNELFSDIEDRPYIKDKRQNFLFAFKSLLYEYWKKSEANEVVKPEYLKHPIIGKAIQQFRNDYVYCNTYLANFWALLEAEKYDELISMCIELPYEVKFSTSDTINILRKFNGELIIKDETKFPFCHISIFPQTEKSYILISWLKEDDYYYNIFRNQFIMLSAAGAAVRLNILLPILAENIVLSPSLFEAWSDEAQEAFLKLCSIEATSFYSDKPVSINDWIREIPFNLFKKIESERR